VSSPDIVLFQYLQQYSTTDSDYENRKIPECGKISQLTADSLLSLSLIVPVPVP